MLRSQKQRHQWSHFRFLLLLELEETKNLEGLHRQKKIVFTKKPKLELLYKHAWKIIFRGSHGNDFTKKNPFDFHEKKQKRKKNLLAIKGFNGTVTGFPLPMGALT